jgi:hypothetical protein
MLSEISQTQKDKSCVVSIVCILKIQTYENREEDYVYGIVGVGW